jgi:hypothetical protein
MKKILVPTDFSEHSTAGLRFAIQWSTVEKIELVFIHVLHISKLPQWTDAYFLQHSENEKKKYKERLEKFVSDVYERMGRKQEKYSCVVIEGFSRGRCHTQLLQASLRHRLYLYRYPGGRSAEEITRDKYRQYHHQI